MQSAIDEVLVWLSVFKNMLTEQVERGLSSVTGSSSQFDRKDGMSSSHSKEGSGAGVVEYEPNVRLKLAFCTTCVV